MDNMEIDKTKLREAVRASVQEFLEEARKQGVFISGSHELVTELTRVIDEPDSVKIKLFPGDMMTAILMNQHKVQRYIPPHETEEDEEQCFCVLRQHQDKFVCEAPLDERTPQICRESDGMMFGAEQVILNRDHRHKLCPVRREAE